VTDVWWQETPPHELVEGGSQREVVCWCESITERQSDSLEV
jgi:hypothetical protein